MYFRAAAVVTGTEPDPRLSEAIDLFESRLLADGRWPLDRRLRGKVWVEVDDGPGVPSRWITLKAPRVLKWWAEDGRNT